MTLVSSAEIGPYNPSPHSITESVRGLDTAGSKNPGRTLTEETQEAREHPWSYDDTPKEAFPYTYKDGSRKGYTVDYPSAEYKATNGGSLKKVIRPDKTELDGYFTKERDWNMAIDADINIQNKYAITRNREVNYGKDKEARTRH